MIVEIKGSFDIDTIEETDDIYMIVEIKGSFDIDTIEETDDIYMIVEIKGSFDNKGADMGHAST